MGSAAEKVRRKLGSAYEKIWDEHPEIKDKLEKLWTDADKKAYEEGFRDTRGPAAGLKDAAEKIGIAGKTGKYAKFWKDQVPPEFKDKELPKAAHKVWGSEEGIEARIELSRAVIAADIPKLYRMAAHGKFDELDAMIPDDVKREVGITKITNAQEAYKAIAAYKKLGDVLRREYGKQT